jgi:SAM-dependent methyltransferase
LRQDLRGNSPCGVGLTHRMLFITQVDSYYNTDYFNLQKPDGRFGGEANLIKFQHFIKPHHHVVDFGCGGGFLLSKLQCRSKIGVDINPTAAQHARELGIQVVEKPQDLPNDWADVVVSDNCLEHALHPLAELTYLYPKVKNGGILIFVVACETILMRYKSDDYNRHLYSWSPLNLGNLFKEAGFKVLSSEPFIHKWPPHYWFLRRVVSKSVFNLLCRIYGRLRWEWFQVRIVARKEI